MRALREFQTKLIEGKLKIFVRRAGPNFQEGLRIMREVGKDPLSFYDTRGCDIIETDMRKKQQGATSSSTLLSLILVF